MNNNWSLPKSYNRLLHVQAHTQSSTIAIIPSQSGWALQLYRIRIFWEWWCIYREHKKLNYGKLVIIISCNRYLSLTMCGPRSGTVTMWETHEIPSSTIGIIIINIIITTLYIKQKIVAMPSPLSNASQNSIQFCQNLTDSDILNRIK